MRAVGRAIQLTASCLLLITATSHAQDEPRRHALVIGLSYYEHLEPLAYAADDAGQIAAALQEARFAVTSVIDQGASGVRDSLRAFAARVQPNDVVVMYYAGHGIQANGRNYLLPSDFPNDASLVGQHALAADELLTAISRRQPRMKLLILDACRNSPLPGVKSNGLAVMEAGAFGGGTRLEFSAATGKAAKDGVYAKHLAAELATPGLEVDAVFRNVRQRVLAETTNGQETLSIGALTESFYFVPGQTMSPSEALAQLDRVAARMPRSELGQTVALQALVEAGHSLGGTEVLEGLPLKGGRFSRAGLSRALLAGTAFDDATLHGADLSRARLTLATLERATVTDATLDGAAFAFARADSASFEKSRARGSTWFAARARGARFTSADLTEAGFMFADLRGANFDGATLTDAAFVGSDLRGASFKGAVLGSTDFTGSLLDAEALSASQQRGACQMSVPAVPQGMYGYVLSVAVIEPIPSSRFDGGFEYSRFLEEQYLFRLPTNSFGACGPRLPSATAAWFPIVSVGDQEQVRDEVSFRLSHKLLQQTGRRAEVPLRVAEHLEWVYAFPTGKYTTVITAADAGPTHPGLAGTWSLEFQPEGRVTLARLGGEPILGRYRRQPRYAFLISLAAGPLGCPAGTIEYRWHLTPDDKLQLTTYPEDSCAGRALVLKKRPWSRSR